MHNRSIMILLLVFTLGAAVCAQTKLSGELKCEKADPVYSLPVGDRPDHFFRIAKAKCTWTKPFEFEGIKAVSEEATYFVEVTGTRARARGLNVGTMANGDKYFVSIQSTGVYKEGVLVNAEVKWAWSSATGKLKGFTAKGISKGKAAGDGSAIWLAEGEVTPKK